MVKDLKTLEVARNLFMKFGIKSVSMDDISKEAGISKKTIYNFVTNKAQLIDFVVDRFIKSEKEDIEKIAVQSNNALDEMIKITEHVILFLRRFKPSLSYDLKKYYKSSWEKVETIHYAFITQTILENIQRGKEEGIYRSDLEESIISKMYMEATRNIVNDEVFPSQDFNKVELFENYIEYHLRGILNEKGLKNYKAYISNGE